jgi:hypothetical protein
LSIISRKKDEKKTKQIPKISSYKVPIQITPDPERSGIWLLGAMVNHSCSPTCHRIVCDNYLMVRAAKDLRKGTQLTDSYSMLMNGEKGRNERED